MNTFIFDTLSDYQSAKAQGGSIYTALAAAGNSPVSASVVSYITATGETLIDAKNVIVDEPYGELGDVLIDKGGTKYWLKSYASYNASSKGGAFCVSAALTAAGYTLIGILVDRQGKEAKLMSLDDTSAAWSNDSTTSPNMDKYGSIRRASKRRSAGYYDTWIASGSRERAESWYGSTYYQFTWPFPRTAWNAMMDKVNSNTAGSDSNSTNWSWTVTATSDGTGIGTASFTCKQTEGDVTFNPKDYGYSFDTWYKQEVEVQWPATAQAASDFKGLQNTKALMAWGGSSASTKCPAANWCNSYAKSVTGYGAGSWWLPSCGELIKVMRLIKILKKKGTFPSELAHWTSTQCSSATNAWYVGFYSALVFYYTRSGSNGVRAFSAYHFL